VYRLLPSVEQAAVSSGIVGGWGRSGMTAVQAGLMAKSLGATSAASAATRAVPQGGALGGGAAGSGAASGGSSAGLSPAAVSSGPATAGLSRPPIPPDAGGSTGSSFGAMGSRQQEPVMEERT
jgi:hypothetical protein